MVMKKVKGAWPVTLPIDDRIEVARERLPQIVDNLVTLIHLHETNRIVCYSNKLASQIPRSYAGHHFKLFQHTMLKGEALRLCTLWDGVKMDRMSLPTISALIHDDEVLATIMARAAANQRNHRHLEAQDDDPELLAWMTEVSDREVEVSVNERDAALRKAISDIRDIEASDMLTTVRQFRDWHMAHSLDRRAKARPDLPYKYGYERELLEKTIPIVDSLYLGVSQAGLTWKDTSKMAKEYAEALWNGCRFDGVQ
jgi:hypothetical protein